MFKVKNEGERATVYIYGTIGEDYWSPDDENRAKAFAQTLAELSPKPLDIRIDSTGGDVYEGFAIASAIQRYDGETHAYVDGIAASAASYIALMADKVTMNDYAMIMIHNAWTLAIGNRDELRDLADRLEAIDKTIAGIISARSALGLDEVLAAMSAETWYTGPEALAAGMCDEVIETEQRMAASLDKAIAKHFKNVPECLLAPEASPVAADLITAGTLTSVQITAGTLSAWMVPEDGAQRPEDGASHAESNLAQNEETDAKGAILLGNRVYRKEN